MLRCFGGMAVLSLGVLPAAAQDVRLSPDVPSVTITLNGQDVVISREQDPQAVITGEAAKIAHACPPNCPQPMNAAEGVGSVGALEVIAFLQADVASGSGLLLDVRLPGSFAKGRIPGAVNVPFATLAAENPYVLDILQALGVAGTAGNLDFSTAPRLVIYGQGLSFGEAAQAVRSVVQAGYPAEKISYFRGGLQEWLLFGLNVWGAADQG